MGRRAKNKQAPPTPFELKENNTKPSPQKLGKRKVAEEEISRPAKKVKETESKITTKPKHKSSGNVKSAGKGGKREGEVHESKLSVIGSNDLSEGWDDVEDEFDLTAQAK
jgi:hypothetical protein